ncbi:MAG: sulfite exporter TauE/SafE family protein [Oscillospiraceae bacterium]|nr:sulfite exporter TauE/SafE family protein [Oscillospiraceae bacterium]
MRGLLSVIAGALCGVLSGYGVGGGSLLMVWMTAVLSMPQRAAQGVNLLFFLPTAGLSIFFHYKNRVLCKKAILPASLGGVGAAILGAILACAIDGGILRKGFGFFLLVVGVLEWRKKPQKK